MPSNRAVAYGVSSIGAKLGFLAIPPVEIVKYKFITSSGQIIDSVDSSLYYTQHPVSPGQKVAICSTNAMAAVGAALFQGEQFLCAINTSGNIRSVDLLTIPEDADNIRLCHGRATENGVYDISQLYDPIQVKEYYANIYYKCYDIFKKGWVDFNGDISDSPGNLYAEIPILGGREIILSPATKSYDFQGQKYWGGYAVKDSDGETIMKGAIPDTGCIKFEGKQWARISIPASGVKLLITTKSNNVHWDPDVRYIEPGELLPKSISHRSCQTSAGSVVASTNLFLKEYEVDADDILEIYGASYMVAALCTLWEDDQFKGYRGLSPASPSSSPLGYFQKIIFKIPEGVNRIIVQGSFKNDCRVRKLDSAVVWGAFGDSITEKNYRALPNYTDFVSADLGLIVKNYGASGTGYMSSPPGTFYDRIQNVDPDIDLLTIMGSINDVKHVATSLGDIDDRTTDTISGRINLTIDRFFDKYPTKRLLLITPIPSAGCYDAETMTIDDGDFGRYVDRLLEIAHRRGIPVLDMYHESVLKPWIEDFKEKYYTSDLNGALDENGVHPNDWGHYLIYPQIRDFIRKYI